MNFAQRLHIVLVIGKYTEIFRRDFFWWAESGEGCYVGESFHGGCFHGGREISMKDAPGFPVLFKNEHKLFCICGVRHQDNTSLFKLKFFSTFKKSYLF